VLTDLLDRLALQTLQVGCETGKRALAVERLAALELEDIANLDRGFGGYELFARFIARSPPDPDEQIPRPVRHTWGK
jgi:hypothetical protein